MEVMEVVMEEAMEEVKVAVKAVAMEVEEAMDLETHLLCYQDCKAQSPTTDQSSCATLEIQKLQDLSCCEQRY